MVLVFLVVVKVVNWFGALRASAVSALEQSVSTWASSAVSFSSDLFFQRQLKKPENTKKMS
jgi:hypothetical protein